VTKRETQTAPIRRGTNNVFADLGFPDPQTHWLKAELMSRVQTILEERQLTQIEAAGIVGVSQPDLSRMLNGRFREVSVERILRMLTRLGCEMEIVVKPRGRKRAFQPILLSRHRTGTDLVADAQKKMGEKRLRVSRRK
jgi:predicted XRE-type DNA-binding protein